MELMAKILDSARQFGKVMGSYSDWERRQTLTPTEGATFRATLALAGFPVKEVTPCAEPDFFFRFTVIDRNNAVDEFATGWLDCAARLAYFDYDGEPLEALAEALQREIQRSRPLSPMVLSDGLTLAECRVQPNATAYAYFVDHTRDNDALQYDVIGVHRDPTCKGWICRESASPQDRIRCKTCDKHIFIPKSCLTYGDLREFLHTQKEKA